MYIIGEVGIEEEMDLIGVPHRLQASDSDKELNMKPGGKLEPDEDIGAVRGFDREINYFKIHNAQLAINEMPVHRHNLDAAHLTDAQEWAGNGAMVGAIHGCNAGSRRWWKPCPHIDYMEKKFSPTGRASAWSATAGHGRSPATTTGSSRASRWA